MLCSSKLYRPQRASLGMHYVATHCPSEKWRSMGPTLSMNFMLGRWADCSIAPVEGELWEWEPRVAPWDIIISTLGFIISQEDQADLCPVVILRLMSEGIENVRGKETDFHIESIDN